MIRNTDNCFSWMCYVYIDKIKIGKINMVTSKEDTPERVARRKHEEKNKE